MHRNGAGREAMMWEETLNWLSVFMKTANCWFSIHGFGGDETSLGKKLLVTEKKLYVNGMDFHLRSGVIFNKVLIINLIMLEDPVFMSQVGNSNP